MQTDPVFTWVVICSVFLVGFVWGFLVGQHRSDRSWGRAMNPRRGNLQRDATKLGRERRDA